MFWQSAGNYLALIAAGKQLYPNRVLISSEFPLLTRQLAQKLTVNIFQ